MADYAAGQKFDCLQHFLFILYGGSLRNLDV